MRSLTRPVAAFALALGLIAVVPIVDGPSAPAAAAYLEEPAYVTVSGAGNGHGVGMSQRGAEAQAIAGASYDDILFFYYGNSSAGTSLAFYDAAVPGHDDLRVNLEYDRTNLMLQVLNTGSQMPGGGHAPATVTKGSSSIDLTHGQTVQYTWLDENTCTLAFRNSTNTGEVPFAKWTGVSCDTEIVWDGEAESPSTKVEIVGCSLLDWNASPSVYRDCQYGRGAALHTIDNVSPQRNTPGMDWGYDGFDLVLEIDVDDYTLGISEVSYGWPPAALEAQAVAARSYGAAAIEWYDPMSQKCACDVYDTSRSQRYVGWGHIGEYSGGQYVQQNWVDACEATDNEVLANPASLQNGVISAVYSASNGGASENNEDVWAGTPLPYFRSTPDLHDLTYDSTWTRRIPVDYFAAKVGLDTVTSAEIVSTYESGSPSHIAVTGTKDGATVTKHFEDSATDKTKFKDVFAGTVYGFPSPRILAIAVTDALPPPPPPPPTTEIDRLWGRDRYATAVDISQDAYPVSADKVFIATGENFPDALAVAPLAHRLGGPVLLTRTGALPAETAAEINRLGAGQIYILGGTAAVSSSVEGSLSAYGAVTRIWGQDRYATAAEISEFAFPAGSSMAYVAVGTNFPDALAGAPAAAHFDGPLLLTRPDAVGVFEHNELKRLEPDTIVVVGGRTSISQSVVDQLAGLAPHVVTLAAGDRYATAVEVSRHSFPNIARISVGSQGFPDRADTVYVARGTDYADALAGGPQAANAPGPILLVPETYLPSTVASELVRLDPRRVVILGGTAAVSAGVEDAIRALFE